MSEIIEQCCNCYYYKERINQRPYVSGKIPSSGVCRKYPSYIDKDRDSWCGEYNPNKEMVKKLVDIAKRKWEF